MLATKDPLVASIERLEAALAADASGDGMPWMADLQSALRDVEQSLGRHPAPSDKNVLSHLELQRREISPTITRGTRTLRKEQEAMLEEIDVLIAQLHRDAVRPEDVPALRQIGAKLVSNLQKFCAAENKLVFDNVMRDTGAGD
jgi:hypothetical protein